MKKIILSVLMLGIMLMIVGSVSAAHDAVVTYTPQGWEEQSTPYPYTINIENQGPDPIKRVEIEPDGYSGLNCGIAPTDWTLVEPYTDSCEYYTTDISYFITTGNSLDFELQATSPSTFGDKAWLVITIDPVSYDTNNFITTVQTIQNAIETDTTGTVTVPAGTYKELIEIDKPLVLQGAGVGNTILDASALGDVDTRKKVILVDVASGDVTIDGFEIILGDNMDGIDSSSGDSSSTLTISNNKITGYGDVTCNDLEDFGIYVHHSAFNAIINDNEIDTNCNPILVERLTGETTITGNTLYAKDNSAGIAFMTYSGTDVTSLQSISDNTINILEASTGGIGIRTSPWWTPDSAGKFTNIEIIDNTITNVIDGTYGIKILNDNDGTPETAEISGVIISENTITGSDGTGIILGGLVVDTIINDNTISGVDEGIYGDEGKTTDDYPTGTLINENSITGCITSGLNWLGLTLLNAESNWWGVITGTEIDALVEGLVDFTPWCYDSMCKIPEPQDWVIELKKGMNLFSIPLVPEDTDYEEVLDGIKDNLNRTWVYQYDEGEKRNKWLYRWYKESTDRWYGSDDFENVVPGYGYIVFMDEIDVLHGVGKTIQSEENPEEYPVIPSEIHLANGYNLIGLFGKTTKSVKNALSSLESSFKYWSRVLDVNGEEVTDLEPGKGYWVSMKHLPDTVTENYYTYYI